MSDDVPCRNCEKKVEVRDAKCWWCECPDPGKNWWGTVAEAKASPPPPKPITFKYFTFGNGFGTFSPSSPTASHIDWPAATHCDPGGSKQ